MAVICLAALCDIVGPQQPLDFAGKLQPRTEIDAIVAGMSLVM